MNERIRYVDGLRGIAVLAVVLYHGGLHNLAMRAGVQTPLLFLLRQGCHGVDLFFVLSGFCLSYPLLARVHTVGRATFNVPAYAARRVVRIVPPYYAAIVLLVVLGYAMAALHVPLRDAMADAGLSLRAIVNQLLFLDRDRVFLNGSFWTLAIEFRWYFVFPLLLWLWIRFPKAFAGVAVAAFIAAGATRIDSDDMFYLPFFMLGIVAAELHVRSIKLPRWAFPGAALSLAAAVAGSAHAGWNNAESGPFWGIAMFSAVVIIGAKPFLRRAVSSNWLVAVGATSYGIYLIHEPIVALIERTAVPRVGGDAAFALAVIGALAAGMLFSYVAERPFLASPLRHTLITALEPAVGAFLVRLGVADAMNLRRSAPAKTEELVA